MIRLNSRDGRAFVKALLNPPKPSARLRTAARRHVALVRRDKAVVTVTADGGMTLRFPRELVSVNQWNGRHWREKHEHTKAWEYDIRAALCDWFGVKDFPSALYVQCLGTQIRNDKGEKVWVSRCEERKRVTIVVVAVAPVAADEMAHDRSPIARDSAILRSLADASRHGASTPAQPERRAQRIDL